MIGTYLTRVIANTDGVARRDYIIGWALIAGILALLPFMVSNFWVRTLVLANIFALFTLSWNFISGHTNYISFGHSFLIGSAGYATGILTVQFSVPLVLSIPASVIIAMVAGLLIFIPALKLRGVYFTFITIAVTIIAESLVIQQSQLTGGTRGLIGVPGIFSDIVVSYYVSGLLMLLIAIAYWLLMRSDMGTIIRMISESEELVENSGIQPLKFKLAIFLMSAFVAGIAGTFKVHHLQAATIDSVLYLILSINIVIAAVIGGRGSSVGAIVGAYFFVLSDVFFEPFLATPLRRIMFFSLGVLIIALYPRGIVPQLVDIARDQSARRGPKEEAQS